MWFDPASFRRALIAALASGAWQAAKRFARFAVLAFLFVGACLAAFGAYTYEARYTDASGARCVSFRIAPNREADLCSGTFDRDAPIPPAFPLDASTETP